MKVFVSGGAGFIGSNLVDRLLYLGYEVVVFDNFSTGRAEFLAQATGSGENLTVLSGDLLNVGQIEEALEGVAVVVHLAANADVRFGWNHPRRDIEQNVIATQNLLETMRKREIKRFLFSSTGSVYGDAEVTPTPENAPFPAQTSLYGASKVAAEGLISAYAENGYINATVFRFVSILGPRYTHGHVIDFVAQLTRSPQRLTILGNGLQRKSYLHVSDCVGAITSRLPETPKYEVFNLGTDDFCTVRESAAWIAARMGFNPTFEFGNDVRGWVGDNPFIYLDTSRIRATSWQTTYSIKESVESTVDWLVDNPWVLSAAVPNG